MSYKMFVWQFICNFNKHKKITACFSTGWPALIESNHHCFMIIQNMNTVIMSAKHQCPKVSCFSDVKRKNPHWVTPTKIKIIYISIHSKFLPFNSVHRILLTLSFQNRTWKVPLYKRKEMVNIPPRYGLLWKILFHES